MTNLEKLLYRTLYKKSFYEFVKAFWQVADPSKFIDGKVIKIYCEIFQYMCRSWVGYTPVNIDLPENSSEINIIDVRQNKNNLCLMVPPRHTKSLIFNVFGPVWLWLSHPIKAVSISHTGALAGQMNSKRYNIINSEKFKELFDDITLITNTKHSLIDNRGGELYSQNRDAMTGYGGDIIINDDLTNAETARRDQAEMSSAWAYFQNTMPSRINDINKCIIMNIQQRLAPNDIAGHIMNDPHLSSTYVFVTLPAEFMKETWVVCPISGDIIKFKKGDFLWPERFGDYRAIKYQVGDSIYETQYLQNPIASDRTIIKRDTILEKDLIDVPSIDNADMVYVSTDFPVKDKETSDYLGSILAYRINNTLYIVDCLEKRMAFVKGVEYIKALDMCYPGSIKICEDKANGSSTIQLLQDVVPGIQAFNPGTQSKMQRLESASYYIGNIVFVKNIHNELTNQYILSESLINLKERLANFPFVEHDDIIDAFSMLVLFVFLDKKYSVYGRAFNKDNLVDFTNKYDDLQTTVFFNKEGDLWKVLEIAVEYGNEINIIIKREEYFKASIDTGLNNLHELFPDKKVFIDASFTDSMATMYKKSVMIERYEESDFDRSVVNLNLMLTKNRVLLNKECKSTRSDLELFKYAKSKDETVKYATEKDGFVACIRIALKYFGIY